MSQPTGKCQKSVCRFKRFTYTDWIRQKPEISGTWSLTPEVRWNFFTFLHSPYFHKWQVGEWWAIMAWFKSLLIAVNKISFLKTTWPVLRNLCNKCLIVIMVPPAVYKKTLSGIFCSRHWLISRSHMFQTYI